MTAWEPSPARPFDRTDLYIAIAVFLLSWITAAWYLPVFRAGGGRAEFYQTEFAPAVMSGCGRGYVTPAVGSRPASLTAFLNRETGTFDCADLPASIQPSGLSMMQGAFRYQMMLAALVWRVRGVSWNAVDIVLSLLFAAGLTAGYVALRFVAGRTLSIAGTLLWLLSPMHLGNLPHLRDYSKTPFFIATLIAMGFVVRERGAARLALAGAVFGLVIGIGFGMRTDVILNLAPFLLVLFVAGARGPREDLPAKCACAVSALLLFTMTAWPILRAYVESEGVAHVGILGLTTPFDEPLGIRPAPYDFGYVYNDSFAASEVRGDWTRMELHTTAALRAEVPYAKAARAYYLKLAAAFPGDFLTRMTGSVVQTLNLPFSITYGRFPMGTTGVIARVGEWRTRFMLRLIGTGPLVVFALMVIVGTSRLRDGVVTFALILFWAAYPFVQFHGRHTFHLEFLVIAAFIALLSLTARSAVAIWNRQRPSLLQVVRAGALALGLVVASILTISLARAVQHLDVRSLLDAYDRAQAQPLSSAATLFEAGTGTQLQQAMIRLDADCEAPVNITVRYAPSKDYDFTRLLTVPARSRTFVPVYSATLANGTGSRFTGVEGASCVRMSRVTGIDHLLWLDATLTPDRAARPLHQRVYIGTAIPTPIWLRLARWWPGISNLG